MRRLFFLSVSVGSLGCGTDAPPVLAPSVPDTLSIAAGSGQSGVVWELLAVDPSVRVVDQRGAPMADVRVVWEVTAGNGELSPDTVLTAADGTASVAWRLGTVAGEQRILASVDGLASAGFVATALPGEPFRVAVSYRDIFLVLIDGPVDVQVHASVLDAHDNVTGHGVVWSVPDPSVAVVDSTGFVQATGAGYSSVQARYDTLVAGASLVVSNPVPSISQLSPSSVEAGAPGVSISVLGSGFVPQSIVLWNGTPRTRTYVDPTRIDVFVPAEDVAVAQTADVVVRSPTPGGGDTPASPFVVVVPPAS